MSVKNEYSKIQPLIDKCEEFCVLDDRHKADLLSMTDRRTIPKGGYFVRAGEVSNSIGFLVSGMLRYFYIDPEGREYTRYFCKAGNFVSSYTSVLAHRPSSYSIQALDDIDLIVFPITNWQLLNAKDLLWSSLTIRVLESAQILSEERERSLILDSATERYLDLIGKFPGIEEKVKQYDLAGYLGITPVALSRIRGRLKSKKNSWN